MTPDIRAEEPGATFKPLTDEMNTNSVNPVITIERASEYAGQTVVIRGWLYNLRESGKLLFPIFRDGTGMIQGVVSLKEHPEAFDALKGLTQESSVIVSGRDQGRAARARRIRDARQRRSKLSSACRNPILIRFN